MGNNQSAEVNAKPSNKQNKQKARRGRVITNTPYLKALFQVVRIKYIVAHPI